MDRNVKWSHFHSYSPTHPVLIIISPSIDFSDTYLRGYNNSDAPIMISKCCAKNLSFAPSAALKSIGRIINRPKLLQPAFHAFLILVFLYPRNLILIFFIITNNQELRRRFHSFGVKNNTNCV